MSTVDGKRSAARTLGWLTTLPYRLPGRRVSIAAGLLGNGRLRIGGPGRVRLAADVNAWSHAEPNRLLTTTADAEIRIGRKARLNGCILIAAESIDIGDGCVLGSCEIRDHLPPATRRDPPYLPESGPVVIEDNVWVGGQVSILPGVRIGRNSVVGIHSVVDKSVPANVLVAGNPARVIRSLARPADDNSSR